MSSQESVGESRVSHPIQGPRANSDANHFGPSTKEEMEADLKRIDAMEEDQEVTSCFRAGFMMGELQSSAIPNSVIPSNVRFLSYENMKIGSNLERTLGWRARPLPRGYLVCPPESVFLHGTSFGR